MLSLLTEKERSGELVGSAFRFGPGDPGLIPDLSLCTFVILGFGSRGDPPKGYQINRQVKRYPENK